MSFTKSCQRFGIQLFLSRRWEQQVPPYILTVSINICLPNQSLQQKETFTNPLPPKTYELRQFNSRNGPVKAKFAYLCTSGYCRLRNTLLVKLCTSWDNSATAGNSLENHFPEYLAVTFSRCVGCQKGQQIFVPSGHFFLISEIIKIHRGAKSGE